MGRNAEPVPCVAFPVHAGYRWRERRSDGDPNSDVEKAKA